MRDPLAAHPMERKSEGAFLAASMAARRVNRTNSELLDGETKTGWNWERGGGGAPQIEGFETGATASLLAYPGFWFIDSLFHL